MSKSSPSRRSLLTCLCCYSTFVSPILLPCHNTICGKHVTAEDAAKGIFECPMCDEKHSIPSNGFYENQGMQELLDMKLRLDKFESRREAQLACDELAETVHEFEQVKRSPCIFIDEYIRNEVSKVGIARDKQIDAIHRYYGEIIERLNHFKAKCLAAVEEFNYSFDELDEAKETLEASYAFLNTFEYDENRWKLMKQELKDGQLRVMKHVELLKMQLLSKNYCYFDESQVFEVNGLRVRGGLRSFNRVAMNEVLDKSIINDVCFEWCTFEFIPLCGFKENDRFKLLYRGSEHGFKSVDFYSRCVGASNTLTIIHSRQGNFVGGYTNIPWKRKNDWQRCNEDSFIFTFFDSKNVTVRMNNIASGTFVSCTKCDTGWHPHWHSGGPMFKCCDKERNMFLYVRWPDDGGPYAKPKCYLRDKLRDVISGPQIVVKGPPSHPKDEYDYDPVCSDAEVFAIQEIEVYKKL